MSRTWRAILITAALAFIAGALGVYAGVSLTSNSAHQTSLDAVMHRELGLSAAQDAAIGAIEARYARRKAELEAQMRAATRDIAAAVAEDGAYTPRVEQAVNRFHMAMGELQRATIEHVFEMRAVLTPAQQRRFDEIVRIQLMKAADEGDRT